MVLFYYAYIIQTRRMTVMIIPISQLVLKRKALGDEQEEDEENEEEEGESSIDPGLCSL